MAPDWLRGCATALATPFDADGNVDLAALRRLVDHQIKGGIKILVPGGGGPGGARAPPPPPNNPRPPAARSWPGGRGPRR